MPVLNCSFLLESIQWHCTRELTAKCVKVAIKQTFKTLKKKFQKQKFYWQDINTHLFHNYITESKSW